MFTGRDGVSIQGPVPWEENPWYSGEVPEEYFSREGDSSSEHIRNNIMEPHDIDSSGNGK